MSHVWLHKHPISCLPSGRSVYEFWGCIFLASPACSHPFLRPCVCSRMSDADQFGEGEGQRSHKEDQISTGKPMMVQVLMQAYHRPLTYSKPTEGLFPDAFHGSRPGTRVGSRGFQILRGGPGHPDPIRPAKSDPACEQPWLFPGSPAVKTVLLQGWWWMFNDFSGSCLTLVELRTKIHTKYE